MPKIKKYQLSSYVKITQKTTLEVVEIFKETNELPFEYSGKNWIYDYEVEYQKRFGVYFDQFHTPPEIVQEFFNTIERYGYDLNKNLLDACCGLGQLALEAEKRRGGDNPNYYLHAFDCVDKMIEISTYQGLEVEKFDFTGDKLWLSNSKGWGSNIKYNIIVSNPPFGRGNSLIKDFLLWAYDYLENDGLLACILPLGIEKKEDKKWNIIWQKWRIITISPHQNEFYNTKTKTATYIFEKLN